MANLLYIGGGYVGACSAAAGADSGHNVLVYDINADLVRKFSSFNNKEIESALFEEGLGDLIIRNKARLKFTDKKEDSEIFIDKADAVFMCLPTPEKDGTGESDLSYYEQAAQDLAKILKNRNNGSQEKYILIVNKSTVPIKMTNITGDIMERVGVKNYGIGSNPEFLVEGKAVEGSIRPQRVVVGASSQKDFEIFRDIYKRFYVSPTVSYIEVGPEEAEAGKLLANFLLFNRLATCFDVVGRTCESFPGINMENIRKILSSDKRIGDWGFYNSLFAGGSCFIKDSRSLAFQLEEKGANTDLVKDVLEANERQLLNFMKRPEKEVDFDWKGKKVGLLGLAFKRHTNDVRNSAALGVTKFLFEKSVEKISAYDPVAGQSYLNYFDNNELLNLNENEEAVIESSDILIVATDWPQFRELTDLIKDKFKGSLIMDGRRMLQDAYGELSENGFDIIAVGSPVIKKK